MFHLSWCNKRMDGGKITKIILLLYCILILTLAFNKNSRGGAHKSKTISMYLKNTGNMMIELKV